MMRRFAPLALVVLLVAPRAAAQSDVVAGLSQDAVEITSTYTGTDLVIFGAIERPDATGQNDIVVEVRGPDAGITIRRKDRRVGVWINDARARFFGMASYYFLAATRPLARIAPAPTLAENGLGLANLTPRKTVSDGPLAPYRAALIRIFGRRGIYTENPTGVEMLSPALFRVHVPLPAAAPRGQYTVKVYFFRDGRIAGQQNAPLFVDQIGFERQLSHFAHNRPFAYGILTVLMAWLLGWLSSLVFRKKY
jgi:uncharacterized protein (TIGR02186 family)